MSTTMNLRWTQFSSRSSLPICYLLVLILVHLLSSLLFTILFLAPDRLTLSSGSVNLADDQIRQREELTKIVHTLNDHCNQLSSRPLFGKLVFILIDAFRADFVSTLRQDLQSNPLKNEEQKMTFDYSLPFTNQLLRNGSGIATVARAQTPTVTMPRLKALLSGCQSSFVDILTNLDARRLTEDNLVSQAYRNGRKMIFYGDDTWLQLFDSRMFVRFNVTYSFFATDYTSVDTNVTENVIPELQKTQEWDLLFAHYLGVDHIGHSYGGYRSSLMQPKLLEMDGVIERIFVQLSRQKLEEDILVVILGDHGMTELGNHGGNSDDESNTAALFFSTYLFDKSFLRKKKNQFQHPLPPTMGAERIQQNDVSVLLSAFLGLDIPDRSQGRLNLRVFDFLTSHKAEALQHKLCYLFRNAKILQRHNEEVAVQFLNIFLQAISLHNNFLSGQESHSNKAINLYDQYIDVISKSQDQTKTDNLNLFLLAVCVVAGFASCAGFLIIELKFGHVLKFTFQAFKPQKWLINSKMSHEHFKNFFPNGLFLFCLASYLAQMILLASTSFIDEEHHFFLYVGTTVVLFWINLTGHQRLSKWKTVEIILYLLVINNWSVSGRFSISSILIQAESQVYLILTGFLVICSLTIHLFKSSTTNLEKLLHIFNAVFLLAIKFSYWMLPISINYAVRIVYANVFLILVYHLMRRLLGKEISSSLYSICRCLIPLFMLLCRPGNLLLILAHVFLEKRLHYLISKVAPTAQCVLFSYAILAQCAFFSSGNSNSISTLDVGPGFTGLNDYNFLIVSFQVILQTYSFFIYWMLMLFVRLVQNFHTTRANVFYLSNLLLLVRTLCMCSYEVISLNLRNHLFIWSVICPKLMYELAHTAIFVIIFAIINTTSH